MDDTRFKKIAKKKKRLYNNYKRSNNPVDKQQYHQFKTIDWEIMLKMTLSQKHWILIVTVNVTVF